MTPFTVKVDFQHGGICYEAGNTHRRHTISDAEVADLDRLGWVSTKPDAFIQAPGDYLIQGPGDVFIKPHDLQIKLIGA